jgi:transposase
LKEEWCIPPEHSAEFVWHMEDVLDVYQRPYDPQRPVVCLDEKPVQLLADARESLPPSPGRTARGDYEYTRQGTANVFVAFEPLANWRDLRVTRQRTRQDFAAFLTELVEGRYRQAQRIVLVMDNLNTHSPASLYELLPAEEAKRIADRLEIHYTPKHGSWLNMAEIEFSVLSKRLPGRLANLPCLSRHCTAIQCERNRRGAGVDWQFSAGKARIKLKRLYPSIEVQ